MPEGWEVYCPSCNQPMERRKRGRYGHLLFCPTCDLSPEERVEIVKGLDPLGQALPFKRVKLPDGREGEIWARLHTKVQVLVGEEKLLFNLGEVTLL